MCRFLEELLATKVMIPAMDYVSTPVSDKMISYVIILASQDFLNKIVILIFDKESVRDCHHKIIAVFIIFMAP